MVEIVSGMASVGGRRVLRPGDTAELDPGYEARLVAAGIARIAGPAPAPHAPEGAPEEGEAAPARAGAAPEGPADAPAATEKGEELRGGAADPVAPTPEAPPAGGIPRLEELMAMKRPELAALAEQWGVECRVGTSNADVAAALAALAAEEAPSLSALGAVQ